MHRRSQSLGLLLAFGLGSLPACITPRDKSRQLSRVAKDWCLTIRASQVLPTYPLTEDLLPGDVFLTTTPIGEEVSQFEERGFLPLDNHLVRLGADKVLLDLNAFYGGRFDVAEGKFPTAVPWDHIPDAKFPSYTFEISRSGGLNLAIPVQGVPVGFNYLGAAQATGSVTISEARTFGADIVHVNAALEKWLAEEDHKAFLAPYGSLPGDPEARPVFLRVVTRIYYTKRVSVHLADADTRGADLKAGAELPLTLPASNPDTKTAAERAQDVVTSLNASLQKEPIGAHVKVVSASSRTITLDEEFTRPVVIGYLAYDRRILPDGSLGYPVSTLLKVNGRPTVEPALAHFDSAGFITAWYTKDSARRVPLLEAWLARNHPGVKMSAFLSQEEYEPDRQRMIRENGIR